MNTKKLIKKHERAIAILKLMEKKATIAKDTKLRIDLEESKPYIESYLLTPKKFFEQLLKDAIIDLNWLEKRYTQMFQNWDEIILREKLNDIINE